LALSKEVTLLLNWENHSKKMLFPLSTLQKVLSTFWKSVEFFALFKEKYDADSLFFKSAIYLGLPKLQVEQCTLVLNKILLYSHAYYSLIPSWK
jgi:hypothetical protein